MHLVLTPEHVHVALNHLPLIGVAIAVGPLIYAVAVRNRLALIGGLALALVCSASVFVVMETGEGAARRFTDGPETDVLDPDGVEWMAVHEVRAERVAIGLYVLLAVSAAGLVAAWRYPRHQYAFGIAALAVALLCVLGLIWVADAGGKIRHTEFRAAQPEGRTP